MFSPEETYAYQLCHTCATLDAIYNNLVETCETRLVKNSQISLWEQISIILNCKCNLQ